MQRSLIRRASLPACSYTPVKYTGMAYDKALQLRTKYLHPAHGFYYSKPLLLHDGHRQYLFDHEGRRYLDMFGGVCSIACGHNHPKVTAAVHEQTQRLVHATMLYLNPTLSELMDTIAQKLPKQHDWVFNFTSSGSEANDFAMLMSRAYTKNFEYVTLRNAYHGMTEGTRSMVNVPGWKHCVPNSPGMLRTLCPHPYHGVLGDNVAKYVADLDDVIVSQAGGKVAGFVAEAIQGVGGLVPLLDGYLPKAVEVVRQHGGLYISDEVQCGWGRLGSHYWGWEMAGVVPDIIVGAKSAANGYAMGVVIAKKEVAESMRGVAYFNTFGGNPVSVAAMLANLKAIEEEKLQQNVHVVGKKVFDGLTRLQEKYPMIGSVRGRGAIMGVELVKDPKTKAPATPETLKVQDMLRERHILVGKGGPKANVLRLQGPMCLTPADADYFIWAMEDILKQF